MQELAHDGPLSTRPRDNGAFVVSTRVIVNSPHVCSNKTQGIRFGGKMALIIVGRPLQATNLRDTITANSNSVVYVFVSYSSQNKHDPHYKHDVQFIYEKETEKIGTKNFERKKGGSTNLPAPEGHRYSSSAPAQSVRCLAIRQYPFSLAPAAPPLFEPHLLRKNDGRHQ